MPRQNDPIQFTTAVALAPHIHLVLGYTGRATTPEAAQIFSRKLTLYAGIALKASAPLDSHALVDQLVSKVDSAYASSDAKELPAADGTKRSFHTIQFPCPKADVPQLAVALGIRPGSPLNRLTLDLPELGPMTFNAYWTSEEFTQEIQVTGNIAQIIKALPDWTTALERPEVLGGCSIAAIKYHTEAHTTSEGKHTCVEFRDTLNLTVKSPVATKMFSRPRSASLVFPVVGGLRPTKIHVKISPRYALTRPMNGAPALPPAQLPAAYNFPPPNPPRVPLPAAAAPAAPANAPPIAGAPAAGAADAAAVPPEEGAHNIPPADLAAAEIATAELAAAAEAELQLARDRLSQELADQAAEAAALKTAQAALDREAREQAAKDQARENDIKTQAEDASRALKAETKRLERLAELAREKQESDATDAKERDIQRLLSEAMARADHEREEHAKSLPGPSSALLPPPASPSKPPSVLASEVLPSHSKSSTEMDSEEEEPEDPSGSKPKPKKPKKKLDKMIDFGPKGTVTKTPTKARHPTPRLRSSTPQRIIPPGSETIALAPKTLPPDVPVASGGADAS